MPDHDHLLDTNFVLESNSRDFRNGLELPLQFENFSNFRVRDMIRRDSFSFSVLGVRKGSCLDPFRAKLAGDDGDVAELLVDLCGTFIFLEMYNASIAG